MTVGKLRSILEYLPQDAEVFSYSVLDECDARIDIIDLREGPDIYHDEFGKEDIKQTPWYCQGFSNAEDYWLAKGSDKPVVFLVGTDECVDYTEE